MKGSSPKEAWRQRLEGELFPIAELSESALGELGPQDDAMVAAYVREVIRRAPAFDEIALRVAQTKVSSSRRMHVRTIEQRTAKQAMKIAIAALGVALFPESRPADVRFIERTTDLKLTLTRPLGEEIDAHGKGRKRRSHFEQGAVVPGLEPWQGALLQIFQAAAGIPFQVPYEAVKFILRRLLDLCGTPPPKSFIETLKAMDRAPSLAHLPRRGPVRERIERALKGMRKLYDPRKPAKKRLRITLGKPGGGLIQPWGAAFLFAKKWFREPMAQKPSYKRKTAKKG